MPKLFWTKEKLAIVRERYPDADNEALAKEIGCTTCALQVQACKLGVRKSTAARGNAIRKGIGERKATIPARMRLRPNVTMPDGARHEIATGVVIVGCGILTHLSYGNMGEAQP